MFHRFVKCHYYHELDQAPTSDLLGNPVNAFHFIRHLYWGWSHIMASVIKDRKWFNENLGVLIWTNTLIEYGNF